MCLLPTQVAGDSDEEDTPLTDSDIESQAADTASQEARQRSASQPRLQIPVLTVEGWERSTQCENCEALVFLPGFNSMTAGSAAVSRPQSRPPPLFAILPPP